MRKPQLIFALTFAAVLVSSACGDGFDLRVTLQVDTTSLPPDTNISETLDTVKDVVERRLDAFGASAKVTVEGDSRLIVETSGITALPARNLLGRTGHLRFMEAEEDEAGDIICRTKEGERFSVEYPAFVLQGHCTNAELTGRVVWKPATGILNSEVRALTGLHLQAGSAQADIGSNDQPMVSIEFTDEGALLFEQITTRLSSPPRPLGIFLDDFLIASPVVNFPISQSTTSIPISQSNTSISGFGTLDEAKTLAILLNSGALPAPVYVRFIEEIP